MEIEVVKSTFYITYVFLITTGTVTFIESLRTPNPVVRHVMNLETCISIIAAYFYSIFIAKLAEHKDGIIPYKEIILTRYTDWMISTPFMLFVLCIILANENKVPFTFKVFLIVILLDIGMLLSGYMGEIGKINKIIALLIGYACFTLLFSFIWYVFMSKGKNGFIVWFTYFSFVVLWGIYGIAYMADEETKNVIYNILDLLAKAFMGIFFWMVFTKSISF